MVDLATIDLQRQSLGTHHLPAALKPFRELKLQPGETRSHVACDNIHEAHAFPYNQTRAFCIIKQIWDSQYGIYLSFDELIEYAYETRRTLGFAHNILLFGSIARLGQDFLNRIDRTVARCHEIGPNHPDYNRIRYITVLHPRMLLPGKMPADTMPYLAVDLLERFVQNGMATFYGLDLNHAKHILDTYFDTPSMTPEMEAQFAHIVQTLFSDQVFISLFIRSLLYRGAPLSDELSANVVDADDMPEYFSDEELLDGYSIAGVLDELKKRGVLEEGDRILDFTGTGVSSKVIARICPEQLVSAMDIYHHTELPGYFDFATSEHTGPVSLDKLPAHAALGKEFPNLHFFVASATPKTGENTGLPFESGSIKVIVLGDVLQHIAYTHGRQVAQELLRVLRDDGIILVQQNRIVFEFHKSGENPVLNVLFHELNTTTDGSLPQLTRMLADTDHFIDFIRNVSPNDYELFQSYLRNINIIWPESDLKASVLRLGIFCKLQEFLDYFEFVQTYTQNEDAIVPRYLSGHDLQSFTFLYHARFSSDRLFGNLGILDDMRYEQLRRGLHALSQSTIIGEDERNAAYDMLSRLYIWHLQTELSSTQLDERCLSAMIVITSDEQLLARVGKGLRWNEKVKTRLQSLMSAHLPSQFKVAAGRIMDASKPPERN